MMFNNDPFVKRIDYLYGKNFTIMKISDAAKENS